MFRKYVRQAIVHTRDGSSIRGIWWRELRNYVIIKQAELLMDKTTATALDGEVFVPRGNIEFIQVLE